MSRKPIVVVFVFILAMLAMASGVVDAAQPPSREGFVPVDQLPQEEQVRAAPLVAAAYGVAWGAVLFYVWTVWRRLGKVERELADVRSRIKPEGRGSGR